MIDSIAFRTRARTIDHLGREQIADCPTAISELWKNAYDAYARKVALNIFSGETPIASITDDGHGMSRAEFESKWLVIGTESKLFSSEATPIERKGLAVRTKQGQKGIGRLSSAYLGSLLLLVTKRESHPFVATLIDWRLFENPYIYLQDIEIPVCEFDAPHELWIELPKLFDKMMGNVWGDGIDISRDLRLSEAWKLMDELEEKEGLPSTKKLIEQALIETTFLERHIQGWGVWTGEDLSGTAMLMAHVAYDLKAQIPGPFKDLELDAANQARSRLVQTLINFTDPFLNDDEIKKGDAVADFEYSVNIWDGSLIRTLISSDKGFTHQNLEDLEHIIDGEIDDQGRFIGRIKAFGAWLIEPVVIPPSTPMTSRSDSRVGAFHLRVGTFEQPQRTTMDQAVHSQVTAQVEEYGGFMVFRNGLRVMPYGRVDNDFFEIEQRRSVHLGREFWSNRRMFGRIALSREKNPNLRDKAGREGLIDNKSAKIFRDLVINVLRTTARRYFGSDSDLRAQVIPVIEEQYKRQQAEESQKKVRARKRREFKSNLEKALPRLKLIEHELTKIATAAQSDALPQDAEALMELRKRISDLKSERGSLALGPAPRNLGALEKRYTEFRAASTASANLLTSVADSISLALERVRPASPREIAYAELNRNAARLHGRLRKWSAVIREIYSSEVTRITDLIDERQKSYHAKMLPLLNDLDVAKITLPELLNQLDVELEKEDQGNFHLFESYISSLRSLQENIDLDVLVATSIEDVENTRAEIARLNGLAQLGITVEIIGHEMEGLENAVSFGLDSFPASLKSTESFKAVRTAHHSLVEKLRFLSPMKLSGERVKTWIKGEQIFEYVRNFLGSSLENRDVDFSASQAFFKFSVYEQASRLYPVFINLVNNAAYWAAQSQSGSPKVILDVIDSKIFIADNGPGVDDIDIRHLFTLFFTKKIRGGRGVGLYLARANLAAGGHTISYETEARRKLLSGANFTIDFRGAKYD
jgi:signal transduction histidine kinase